MHLERVEIQTRTSAAREAVKRARRIVERNEAISEQYHADFMSAPALASFDSPKKYSSPSFSPTIEVEPHRMGIFDLFTELLRV